MTATRKASPWPTVSLVTAAATGFALTYFSYEFAAISPNIFEILGAGLFWCAVVFLLLAFPLRRAAKAFSKYAPTPAGVLVFVGYLVVHLLLYGFVFEAILDSIYGSGVPVPQGLFVSTVLFVPQSLLNAAADVMFYPSIVVTVPPTLAAALSFYNVSIALVIAVLVLANIGEARELNRARTAAGKARVFVLLPSVGILFGASCCLSVAGVLGVISPTALAIVSAGWVYYGTYFVLPLFAIAFLYLNLVSIMKVSTGLPAVPTLPQAP